MASDPQKAKVVAFPDLTPATRRDLMRGEIGTEFDQQSRVFGMYAGGDVFDYGEWSSRDVAVMLRRDGQASALEAVLTLPIRQASRAIEPGKHDAGEADLCHSVLFAPGTSGGMKTPLQDVIGQVTSAQIYRKSFHELLWNIREKDGAIALDGIAFRPTATCELKRDARTGRMDGFRQQVWQLGGFSGVPITTKQGILPGYVDIPRVKSFVHINGRHREPLTGTSELDLTYWALAHGSEVQTPDGPVPVEEITTGDFVFGSNGEPTRVTGVYPQGTVPAYRVTFSDDSSVECSADHLWTVSRHVNARRIVKETLSTREISSLPLRYDSKDKGQPTGGRGRNLVWIDLCPEVQYPERDLPVDPYVLGAWLGDGCIGRHRHDGEGERTGHPSIACQDSDVSTIEEIRSRLPGQIDLRKSGRNSYSFVDTLRWHQNSFKDALVALGVNKTSHEKFIPEIYLYSSPKQRWDLLRGLMDTDGGSDRTRTRTDRSLFGTVSPRLAADVVRLVQSLGGKATITRVTAPPEGRMLNGREVRHNHQLYRLEVRTPRNPFLLPRKAALWKGGETRRSSARYITGIEPVGDRECTCISVEADDGLFLTNEFIITHNCYKTKLKLIFLLRSGSSFWSSRACPRSLFTARTSGKRTRGPTTSHPCAQAA
jgi:hypothetical protein